MNIKNIFMAGMLLTGMGSASVFAQSGELIATASYVKPGCSWQLIATHTGGFGGGGPSGPLYEYHLKCGAEFVAFRLQYNNSATPTSCYTSGYDQAKFTLNGNLCSSSFSVTRK